MPHAATATAPTETSAKLSDSPSGERSCLAQYSLRSAAYIPGKLLSDGVNRRLA